MERKTYKLPLETGFAALCSHVNAIKKTAEQAGSAVTSLAGAAEKTVKEIEEILNEKQDINPYVAFLIPATGWKSDAGQFPYYCDFAIDGLLETDIVAVDVEPDSTDAARAADFTTTQTFAGMLRLRAKNVPAQAIAAQYRIISTAKYTTGEMEA